MKLIDIARDYSDTPLGRYPKDGDFNGERFREEFLVPALQEGDVTVRIDGVEGYGSSFLEEAFGGLVRSGHFTEEQLKQRLKIVNSKPKFRVFETLIWKHIKDEQAKIK